MLPVVRTDQEWQAVICDEQVIRPAAEDLAGRLGLADAGLRRYPGGSRPVYAAGGCRVLKLYPVVSAPDSVTEARVPGTWTLSGLLDFETAMTGDRACEFAAAGLFLSRGDPRLPGRILAAYGRSFDPRELLAHTLLHRHSNLPECLSQLPARPEPTLDSLALTWFGTA
jgi:hypothetical protein